jgi:hypothetical protein
MERGDPDSPFHMKIDKFNRYEKIKLHPEIYKSDTQDHIKYDLKPKITTYVRKQFKGSTQNITMEKIEDSLWHLLRESPAFWHDDGNFKKIFLERFARDYPLCCDGDPVNMLVESTRKSISAPVPPSQKAPKKNNNSSKKKILSTRDLIVGVIFFLGIRYIMTKIIF